MKDGPSIASVAALIGDRARADILTALVAGPALTATELAAEAGVTKQTTSAHLAKLLDASGHACDVVFRGAHRVGRRRDDDRVKRCGFGPARASLRSERPACATTISPASWACSSTTASSDGDCCAPVATICSSPARADDSSKKSASISTRWRSDGARCAGRVWIGARAGIIWRARSAPPCSPVLWPSVGRGPRKARVW